MASYTNTFPGWEQQVLKLINAPATSQNVDFLDTWNRYEGSNASNNPLNTTQTASGASDYNSDGVKNYPSPATGALATAQTLQNGRYNAIVGALRTGNPNRTIISSPSTLADELRTWGSKSFAATIQAGDPVDSHTGPNSTAGGQAAHDVYAGSGAKSVVDSTVSIGKFLGKLSDPSYILRGLQLIGGAILMLVGLVLLARQVGLAPDVPAAATAVANKVPAIAAAKETRAQSRSYSEGHTQGRRAAAKREGRKAGSASVASSERIDSRPQPVYGTRAGTDTYEDDGTIPF